MGGQRWVRLIRIFSRIQPWLHFSSHLKYAGLVLGGSVPSLPRVSRLSDADRGSPQRPELWSSPEERSRPAASLGRCSAQISALTGQTLEGCVSRDLGGSSPHHQVYLPSPVLQKHREKLGPRARMTGKVLAARSKPEAATAWGREGVRVGGGFKPAPNTGSVTV